MNTNNLIKQSFLIIFLVIRSFSGFTQDQTKAADIKLQFSDKDTVKTVTASLHELINNEIQQPIKNTEVHFYVQRTFSLLSFGADGLVTDDNGDVTAVFPSDLPGDSIGDVTVVVKLEDADNYPDTEVRQVVKWGIPVISDDKFEKRSLWASGANAPISYLLLINGLIAAAWILILFIIFKLLRIGRL